MKKSLFILTGVLLLASCTIQQRVHQPGWYFQWNHSKNQSIARINEAEELPEEIIASSEMKGMQASRIENHSKGIEMINQDLSLVNSNETRLSNSIKVASNANSIIASYSTRNLENQTLDRISTIRSAIVAKMALKFPVAAGNGKSWIVALLLCFFLGALGIHRFYLGYTGMGILYLLTLGLFGIGILVDFILILVGALQPKGGRYSDH